MKLTDAERSKLAAAVKHFEALQKRYTRQHNGTACEYVRLALEGLERMEQEPEVVRCGDCAHYSTKRKFPECRQILCMVEPNDFCSYGERRKEPDDG